MTAFMPQAYRYKEVGDYGVTDDFVITMEHANAAIRSADAFLDGIRKALG
jgi:uncharacterized protein (UPF0332 family)